MKTIWISAALAVLVPVSAGAAPHEGSAFIRDYDADHDGKVARSEFDEGRVARFKATDANGDSWVSEDEYVSEYRVRLERELVSSDLSAEKRDEERQRQIRQAHVRFGVLDRDKDTRITQAEYDASGARAFAEQDDDKDGIVTALDTAATAARRQAARDVQRQ